MSAILVRNPAVTIEALAGFVITTSLAAVIVLLHPGSAGDWIIDHLNGIISGLLTLLIGQRLALGVKNRVALAVWIAAFVVTFALSLSQFWDSSIDTLQRALHVEGMDDLGLWLVTPIGFVIATRFDRVGKLPIRILAAGFCVQSLSTLLDLLDGWLTNSVGCDSDVMAMAVDFSEFVFLQLYLVGLTLFVTSFYLNTRPGGVAAAPVAVGTRARSLFDELGLQSTLRFPSQRAAHLPGVRYVLDLGRIVYCTGRLGRQVRDRFGISIPAQLNDIVMLMMRDDLDAQAYYMLELYRDGRLDTAGQYLTRYETKNGLYKALNMLLPRSGGRRSKLGDKLMFAELCRVAGVPTPPIFVTFAAGMADWRIADLNEMDCDLFVKLRRGKGADGATCFPRIAPGFHRAPDGSEISREDLIAKLQRQSMTAPVIVQPRLTNHGDIADLATDSLMVIRVITCLDQTLAPVVTHGMLRILGKIEQDWSTTAEFGAGVDLKTGRLGPLASDKIEQALDWLDRHPITGAEVEGRSLPLWPEVKSLALQAHNACRDRVIIGWDIAITPQGPLVIEGNSMPDPVFLQRVHRIPAGASPLGPLLSFHLDRLEAARKKARSEA